MIMCHSPPPPSRAVAFASPVDGSRHNAAGHHDNHSINLNVQTLNFVNNNNANANAPSNAAGATRRAYSGDRRSTSGHENARTGKRRHSAPKQSADRTKAASRGKKPRINAKARQKKQGRGGQKVGVNAKKGAKAGVNNNVVVPDRNEGVCMGVCIGDNRMAGEDNLCNTEVDQNTVIDHRNTRRDDRALLAVGLANVDARNTRRGNLQPGGVVNDVIHPGTNASRINTKREAIVDSHNGGHVHKNAGEAGVRDQKPCPRPPVLAGNGDSTNLSGNDDVFEEKSHLSGGSGGTVIRAPRRGAAIMPATDAAVAVVAGQAAANRPSLPEIVAIDGDEGDDPGDGIAAAATIIENGSEDAEDEGDAPDEDEVNAEVSRRYGEEHAEDTAVALRMMNCFNRNRGGHVVSSVERKINKVYDHWDSFMEYCKVSATRHFDRAHKEGDVPVLMLRNVRNEWELLWSKMRAFVDYCDRMEDMTFSKMSTVCYFLQTHLYRQCQANNCGEKCPKGCVTQDAAINGVRKKYLTERSLEAMMKCEDMIAGLECDVDFQQMLNMSREVFFPTCQKTAKMDALGRIQTYAQMVESASTMRRGEDLRCGSFAMQTVIYYEEIGPSGSLIDLVIRNKGKTNKSGTREASGHSISTNPVKDFAAWQGFCFLYRFVVLNEKFPNLLDSQDLHSRPLYRSMNHYKHGLDYAVQYDQYTSMFDSQGVIVNKVTHQFRGQAMREMDRHDIDHVKISRLAGVTIPGSVGQKQNKSQVNHYMTNPPVQAMVERAGGNHKYPEIHKPAWATVDFSADLLTELCPFLTGQRERIDEAVRQCGGSYKKMKAQCLHQAKAVYDAMANKIKRALLMFAARPHDVRGKLIRDALPPYAEFPGFPLFRLDFFKERGFLQLVERVKRAQDAEDLINSGVTEESLDLIRHNLRQEFLPFLREQETRMTSMCVKLQEAVEAIGLGVVGSGGSGRSRQRPNLGPPQEQEQSSTQQLTGAAGSPNVDDASSGEQGFPLGRKKDGSPRRRQTPVKRLFFFGNKYVMSEENVTAKDFWDEYKKGINGQKSIEYLEKNEPGWRKDPPGKTSFRSFWQRRSYIYKLIEVKITGGATEEEAVAFVQEMFNQRLARTGKPILKELAQCMGRKYRELVSQLGEG